MFVINCFVIIKIFLNSEFLVIDVFSIKFGMPGFKNSRKLSFFLFLKYKRTQVNRRDLKPSLGISLIKFILHPSCWIRNFFKWRINLIIEWKAKILLLENSFISILFEKSLNRAKDRSQISICKFFLKKSISNSFQWNSLNL